MTCPNGHGNVSDSGGRVSDGTEVRMTLSCGCHPTASEIGHKSLSAALPPEAVLEPTVTEGPSAEPLSQLVHDEVERILKERGLQ